VDVCEVMGEGEARKERKREKDKEHCCVSIQMYNVCKHT